MKIDQIIAEQQQVNELGEKSWGALKGMFSKNPLDGAKAGWQGGASKQNNKRPL